MKFFNAMFAVFVLLLQACSVVNYAKTDRLIKDGLIAFNTQDCETAYEMWNEAKTRYRDPAAINNIGLIHEQGCPPLGIKPDQSKAFGYFKTAAELKYALGMRNTGLYYWKGLGVEASKTNAEKWYEAAAKAGDKEAKNWLDEVSHLNQDVTYKKLVTSNQLINEGLSEYRTGNCEVAYTNWVEAMNLSGSAAAYNNIGLVYTYGCSKANVPQNFNEALRFYQIGSSKQLAVSMRNIGDCYLYGRGVTQDPELAINWYKKAEKGGDVLASQRIALLEEKLRKIEKKERKTFNWGAFLVKALDVTAAGLTAYGEGMAAAAELSQSQSSSNYTEMRTTDCRPRGEGFSCTTY